MPTCRCWGAGSWPSCVPATAPRRWPSKGWYSRCWRAPRASQLRLHGTMPPRWVTEARDLLHDPGRVGSLGELAEAVGVHPVTLARGFRKAYGCSVGAYLRRLRVARAAERLAETDNPLAGIALEAGFADQSHFSNLFRRETGVSPSAFRRSVRPR